MRTASMRRAPAMVVAQRTQVTDVLIAMVDAVRAKDIDRQRELFAQARQTAEKART